MTKKTRECHPPVILNRKRSASDWGSSWIWIPVFTGMTEGRCGIQIKRLDSRFHGNDGKKSGNDTPQCHPQPKAPLSSSTESPLVILNRKRSASDWGSSWLILADLLLAMRAKKGAALTNFLALDFCWAFFTPLPFSGINKRMVKITAL